MELTVITRLVGVVGLGFVGGLAAFRNPSINRKKTPK
jgi:hypothetical protein